MSEALFEKILAIPAIKSADSAKIDKLIEKESFKTAKTTMSRLVNLADKAIRNKQNPPPVKLFSVIGKVMDKHTPADSRSIYSKRLTILRKAITDTYGEQEGFRLIKESGISNSQRTIQMNLFNKAVRDKKHMNSFNISLSSIELLIAKMKEDMEQDAEKYRHAILLIMGLTTGARIGEIIGAGKFTLIPERKIGDKTVPFIRQTGVLKKRLKKGKGADDNHDDEEDYDEDEDDDDNILQSGGALDKAAVIEKPILPYVNAKWMIDSLKAWRKKHKVKDGEYSEKLSTRFNTPVNKLLQTYYLKPDQYPGVRIKTHLLRAVYAAAAYQLYSGPQQTLNSFTQMYLGHDNLETGLSYTYVKITDSNKEVRLEASEKTFNEVLLENIKLKKRIAELEAILNA